MPTLKSITSAIPTVAAPQSSEVRGLAKAPVDSEVEVARGVFGGGGGRVVGGMHTRSHADATTTGHMGRVRTGSTLFKLSVGGLRAGRPGAPATVDNFWSE